MKSLNVLVTLGVLLSSALATQAHAACFAGVADVDPSKQLAQRWSSAGKCNIIYHSYSQYVDTLKTVGPYIKVGPSNGYHMVTVYVDETVHSGNSAITSRRPYTFKQPVTSSCGIDETLKATISPMINYIEAQRTSVKSNCKGFETD